MSVRCGIACLVAAVLLCPGAGRAEPAAGPGIEVSVEVKFVEVPQELLADLRQRRLLGEATAAGPAVLDAAGVARLLKAVQADVRTNVLQAPRITTLDRRRIAFEISDGRIGGRHRTYYSRDKGVECRTETDVEPLGIALAVRPVVSADHRSVRVRLELKWTDLVYGEVDWQRDDPKWAIPSSVVQPPHVNKLWLNRTLSVPDMGTAVLTGLTRQAEVSKDVGPEALSRVPLLGDLFRKVEQHCETHPLLVLVTPRILSPREEEKHSHRPHGEALICPCCHTETRTPILPPVPPGREVRSEEPSVESVLRALPAGQPRDNVGVVTERVVDEIDPPRFFPLIGPARMHHCHWKCTVYSTRTVRGSFPFAFRVDLPRVEVVYLDLDHLHLAADLDPTK